MVIKGERRDMDKWRAALLEDNVHFPNESDEYRTARSALLDKEAELRRLGREVTQLRRQLPPGGLVKEDYVFESTNGKQVKFSELFERGYSVVIYSMMFPRWCGDKRAAAPCGSTAKLPLPDQPCPSCTSVVDGLEGAAIHLAERTNLVVVAKAGWRHLATYAKERGWKNIRILSSKNNTFNEDYLAESNGIQRALLHSFVRRQDGIHHHWTSEGTFKFGDTSALDPIWPIFGVLDVTVEGRGDVAAFPNLQY